MSINQIDEEKIESRKWIGFILDNKTDKIYSHHTIPHLSNFFLYTLKYKKKTSLFYIYLWEQKNKDKNKYWKGLKMNL